MSILYIVPFPCGILEEAAAKRNVALHPSIEITRTTLWHYGITNGNKPEDLLRVSFDENKKNIFRKKIPSLPSIVQHVPIGRPNFIGSTTVHR